MSREANRARWPELAGIKDRYGDDCKLLWAMDAKGEIGMQPVEPDHFWMTAEGICALEAHYKAAKLDEWRRK